MNLAENRLVNYLKSAREELAKVSWPSRKSLINNTVLVIGVSLLMAVFLGLLDMLFSWGIQKIIS